MRHEPLIAWLTLVLAASGCTETSPLNSREGGVPDLTFSADADLLSAQTEAARTVNAACTTLVACGLLFEGTQVGCTGILANINNPYESVNHFITPDSVRCLSTAGADCAAAARCLNEGKDPAPCVDDACDGTSLVACDLPGGDGGGLGRRFDCAPFAATCRLLSVGGQPPHAHCYPTICDGMSGNGCVGPVGYSCNVMASIFSEDDCRPLGATCALDNHGFPECIGAGPACNGPPGQDALRCDGSVLVSCLGHHEARFDCSTVGQGCFSVDTPNGKQPRCAYADQCSTSYTPTCDGRNLTYCNKGLLTTIDCVAFGFRGCSVNQGVDCTR